MKLKKSERHFVYIFWDTRDNRYYIGSHTKKKLNDDYVCSSDEMLAEYEKRPHDFRKRILAECFSVIDKFDTEHLWLKKIKNEDVGKKYYNKIRSANHWTRETVEVSPETRLKRSLAAMGEKNPNYGKKHTPEIREKISAALRGKKHTDAHKKKISESLRKSKVFADANKARRGIPHTEEHKRNISKGNMGRKHSSETIKKIVESRKWYSHGEETKRKIGEANSGRKHSEESKRKMREGHARRKLEMEKLKQETE